MDRKEIAVLYKKYDLQPTDVFKHKHYLIINRAGIEKIQAKDKIMVSYEAVSVQHDFCVVKAIAKFAQKDGLPVETFGSAKYGGKVKNDKGKWIENGTTTTWYVMEMAEKRAMSRAVLKITGFYKLGVMSEDESEEFEQKNADNGRDNTAG